MDIDTRNFEQVVDKFAEELQKCLFLAIDLEMTGIPTNTRSFYLQSAQEQYEMKREVASSCSICQIGICLVFDAATVENGMSKPDADGRSIFREMLLSHQLCKIKEFSWQCYNFYVYPRGVSVMNQDVNAVIRCNSQEIEFLANHGFDFTRWIKYGINYTDKKGEEWLLSAIKLESSISSQLMGDSRPYFTESREMLDQSPKLDNDIYLKRLLGFRDIWNLVVKARRPVVFHNGLLDMMYLIHALEQPLPQLYRDFKFLKNNLFPETYDTKHIAALFRNSPTQCHLRKLYDSINFAPGVKFLPLDESQKYASDDNSFHEAGYDALQTARVFSSFISHDENCETVINSTNQFGLYDSFFSCNCIIGSGNVPQKDDVLPFWKTKNGYLLFPLSRKVNVENLLDILGCNLRSSRQNQKGRMAVKQYTYHWISAGCLFININVNKSVIDQYNCDVGVSHIGLPQLNFINIRSHIEQLLKYNV